MDRMLVHRKMVEVRTALVHAEAKWLGGEGFADAVMELCQATVDLQDLVLEHEYTDEDPRT